MLNPIVCNEYVLAAWLVAKDKSPDVREGAIFGPRGAAVYTFAINGDTWEFVGSTLL